MNYARLTSSPESAAYDAVKVALSGFRSGELVSTRTILNTVRRLAPACLESDEELVALIVPVATGRTMAVSFDHKRPRL